ncbi:MAG: membrane protein insertion efficiency factor YidD [Firmicutes bacterium]|nr:membrane protein insertion efficiency factor YidD [Bacillota bacterium]
MKKIIEIIGCLPVYFYRFCVRPWLPKSCAFTPTCSEYALVAIKRHGIIVGWFLASGRILRCNPFARNNKGYEPVPYRLRSGAKWVV